MPAPVFELVTPEGERRWAPGWNPRYLTGSALKEHTVFETGGRHHPHIGLVERLDVANHRIRYIALRPDKQLATIDVAVVAAGKASHVSVAYNIVSLSADNDAAVRTSSPDPAPESAHWRAAFEAALNAHP